MCLDCFVLMKCIESLNYDDNPTPSGSHISIALLFICAIFVCFVYLEDVTTIIHLHGIVSVLFSTLESPTHSSVANDVRIILRERKMIMDNETKILPRIN